jgi:SAM-dependent methyltransferase
MSRLDYAGPNAEQIKYWNESRGQTWVEQHAMIDEQIQPLGARAMDRAALQAGERVLDVGCGCGPTTLELARRVGGTGSVLGIDLSSVMLDYARRQPRPAGAGDVRFEEADAQTHVLPAGAFDVLFSRFGVMFFADPRAAFANLAKALRPGGRVTFVCWRTFPENPWMSVPMMAALQHIPPPPIPGPEDPGPFAFASQDRVRGILEGAGFSNVTFDPIDQELHIGGSRGIDAAVDFILKMGPTAAALRDVGPEKRAEVAGAVREAVRPYHGPDGVKMGGAAWIVTARRP